ncbi:MAG: SPOR domain-containing protein [Rhodospirillaceae bacterium]
MMSHQGQLLRHPLRQSDGKDERGSFTDPVFDDDYYGRDQAGGKGRTIGLVVGVVVGAIIAGAAAWTVFGPGANQDTARTPLIVANPEPYKARPEDPGGMQVENQDKLVYERVGGATPPAGAENILPPPEAPKAPAPEPVPESAPDTAPESVTAPIAVPTPSAAAPIAEPATVPAESDSLQPPPPAPAAETPAAPVATATPASPVEPQVEPQAEPTTAASSSATRDPLSGDHLIQIAALRSEEAAQAEWQRISSRYASLLAAYRPVIVRADLGERGIFFRLRAGPVNGRPAADELCAALAAENIGCLVVRNE